MNDLTNKSQCFGKLRQRSINYAFMHQRIMLRNYMCNKYKSTSTNHSFTDIHQSLKCVVELLLD